MTATGLHGDRYSSMFRPLNLQKSLSVTAFLSIYDECLAKLAWLKLYQYGQFGRTRLQVNNHVDRSRATRPQYFSTGRKSIAPPRRKPWEFCSTTATKLKPTTQYLVINWELHCFCRSDSFLVAIFCGLNSTVLVYSKAICTIFEISDDGWKVRLTKIQRCPSLVVHCLRAWTFQDRI